MLTPRGTDIVLWIHVVAACLWIGGQITLGMLVPTLRAQPELLARAARRFQGPAWAAFVILIVTGIANIRNAGISASDFGSTAAGRTLSVKLGFVALSGVAAGAHAFIVAPRASRRSTAATRALSGALGALALLAAIAAALFGVVIASH